MGWISNRRMKTGVGLAHDSKKGRRSGLLRKIVGTTVHEGIEYELLECGHRGRAISTVGTGGMFGTQDADSRRCMPCKKEKDEQNH